MKRKKALGGVSTVGLVALIEAMDAMAKTAKITIRELHNSG